MKSARPGRTAPAASLLTLLLLAACGTTPTAPSRESLTVTAGADAPISHVPIKTQAVMQPDLGSTLDGSFTRTVMMNGCTGASLSRKVIYALKEDNKPLDGTATITFPTEYTFDGVRWVASADPNAQAESAGTQSFSVTASSGQIAVPVTLRMGANLSQATDVPVTIDATEFTNTTASNNKRLTSVTPASMAVNISACSSAPVSAVISNRAPEITVSGLSATAEATGPAGAAVNFTVTANDPEEGDLTTLINCSHTPGVFPIGTTSVECEVTDSGKQVRENGEDGPQGVAEKAVVRFTVVVVDTTPPTLIVPSSSVAAAATGMDGVTPDYRQWVSATDLVDGAVTPLCSPTSLPVGLNQTVECIATDSRGNASLPQSFTVNVTFASASRGLLQPVNDTRNGLPISLFKAGSTIPLKFLPPTFAGGQAATELAGGLRLVVTTVPTTGNSAEEETTDLSSGSTVWRYDLTAGQYVFNLSTKNAFFRAGTGYHAEISFKGVPVASGDFRLK